MDGLRDIVVALILTCVFIVFADYLLNDNICKYCIIPNNYSQKVKDNKDKNNKKLSQKEINDAINILKKARHQKNNHKSSSQDYFINKGLYKENFI